MLVRFGFVAVWVLIASGCTHRHVLEQSATPEVYREMSKKTARRDAEVLLREGQVFRWYDVQITADSVWGVAMATGPDPIRPAVRTSLVLEIETRSRWRGVLDGSMIGGAIGAALGLAIGSSDSCTTVCGDTRLEEALITGVSGALWGMLVGAIRSSRTKVEVQ